MLPVFKITIEWRNPEHLSPSLTPNCKNEVSLFSLACYVFSLVYMYFSNIGAKLICHFCLIACEYVGLITPLKCVLSGCLVEVAIHCPKFSVCLMVYSGQLRSLK